MVHRGVNPLYMFTTDVTTAPVTDVDRSSVHRCDELSPNTGATVVTVLASFLRVSRAIGSLMSARFLRVGGTVGCIGGEPLLRMGGAVNGGGNDPFFSMSSVVGCLACMHVLAVSGVIGGSTSPVPFRVFFVRHSSPPDFAFLRFRLTYSPVQSHDHGHNRIDPFRALSFRRLQVTCGVLFNSHIAGRPSRHGVPKTPELPS